MNIKRVLLKAINHKQWVSIEYINRDGNTTKYWIGIKDYYKKEDKNGEINLVLLVDLFNVTKEGIIKDATIYLNRITDAKEIEGTYFENCLSLDKKIEENIDDVVFTFNDDFDDNILNYFEDCYKLDNTPYISKFSQILGIDQDTLLENNRYPLSEIQFKNLINKFSPKEDKEKKYIETLAMNVISIHSDKGLYVLAYKKLLLDLDNKTLVPDNRIILNKAFMFKDGDVYNEISAKRFLDDEDYDLLDSVSATKEQICDALSHNVIPSDVDDSPHILSLGRDFLININKEYTGIVQANEQGILSYPLRSFFGQITSKPERRTTYPICLASEANLDQMLVIYQALKYPVTFVQGPPGTGKTKTITNLLINCLFNDKTVLVSTNNNVPLDGIFKQLSKMKYKGTNNILFPMLRLGNDENIRETLNKIASRIVLAKEIKSDSERINAVKERYSAKKKELKEFLEKYAEKIDLEERLATLQDNSIRDAFSLRSFEIVDTQVDKLQEKLEKYADINENNELVINTKEVDNDILMYLYFESANKIKKIFTPKYDELRTIILSDNEDKRLDDFKNYISDDEKLHLLLKIFPIIFTTNMSAHKIGSPTQHFDLVVMDEAGQCNAAISLIPIIRGSNLLLVGDTCQLKPVIVLDPINNDELKKKYKINNTYDYIDNSILKMFYTNDTVSNMILLKNHYRCDPKIISFNNQKFYNKKLSIKSIPMDESPLVFVDVPNGKWSKRNTSVEEEGIIVDYCKQNQDKSIGIITPFVNQRNLINENLKATGMDEKISCGTIHEFQGDEKDIIIFSTAITSKTGPGTYQWLMNNKELFNVATSRAKQKLIVLGNEIAIKNLHYSDNDIFYDLYKYIKSNGEMEVSFLEDVGNRALDIKPFSSELEKAFLDNLLQVIECNYASKITFRKEVAAASIFNPKLNEKESPYFYSCRFDFVLFDSNNDYPLLAIELCGPEHQNNEVVIQRDNKKKEICKNHNFDLIFVDNAYARRYGQLKQTLLSKLFVEEKKEIKVTAKKVVKDDVATDLQEISSKQRKEKEEMFKKANKFLFDYYQLIANDEIKKAYNLLKENSLPILDEIVKTLLKNDFKKGLFNSIKYVGKKDSTLLAPYLAQLSANLEKDNSAISAK